MLSQIAKQSSLQQLLGLRNPMLVSVSQRYISSKATHQKDTEKVKLRGKFLKGRNPDLPTLIWLPDVIEPAENFTKFFTREDNKIANVRNVWLLNYRNQGDSDHHDSFALEDMSNDIARFMDENKITMATIGGHGFGAKVATATAVNHMNRFTGVICLEGGPVDHKYHEAYQELVSYIEAVRGLKIENLTAAEALKKVSERISHPKWRQIFLQNILTEKGTLQWQFNIDGLYHNTRKHVSDIAHWGPSYGLWPGQALAIFAAHSRWIHLSTNTLPFYNVFPRLQNKFPSQIFTFADDFDSPLNHWLHEEPQEYVWNLSQRIHNWLRWHDGANVLLADKSEAGWYYVPDRGFDTITNTIHGEYTPEHVHHNYLYTDSYDKSRQKRGKEGAGHGQFLPVGQFSPKDKWF